MKHKFSAADSFYDRMCADYTLKYRDAGTYCTQNMKISAYRIENLGNVCIIRVSGSFGKMTESAVVTPLGKDAPVFMMDRVKTLGKDTLSLNILQANLSRLYYRQFLNASENYGKLPDVSPSGRWYQDLLIQGSVTKDIKGNEAAAGSMIEEYLDAYIKVMEFAERCLPASKAVKIAEISEQFMESGSESAAFAKKAMGPEKAEQFFSKVLFAEELS